MSKHKGGYNKKTVLLICLILLQVVIILVNAQWSYNLLHMSDHPSQMAVVNFAMFTGMFVGLSTVFLVIEIIRLANKERDYEINKVLMEQDKDLIDVLRANRHDFSNHLQVIMGFLQLGKNDMVIQYIKEYTGKLECQSSVSNLRNFAVAALLLKKQGLAEEAGIKLAIDLKSDLEGLRVAPADLSRILGNLIDNALVAVKEAGGPPEVAVTIEEDDNGYKFSVLNKDPVIPEEMHSKIFEKGFTTKGNKGSGLGLYIVKQLTELHGGTVNILSSVEDGTNFTVHFPTVRENNM